jgi:hypothetical protein
MGWLSWGLGRAAAIDDAAGAGSLVCVAVGRVARALAGGDAAKDAAGVGACGAVVGERGGFGVGLGASGSKLDAVGTGEGVGGDDVGSGVVDARALAGTAIGICDDGAVNVVAGAAVANEMTKPATGTATHAVTTPSTSPGLRM